LVIYLSLITYEYGLILSQPYSIHEARTITALLNIENNFS
jgi:hypothetical protein